MKCEHDFEVSQVSDEKTNVQLRCTRCDFRLGKPIKASEGRILKVGEKYKQ